MAGGISLPREGRSATFAQADANGNITQQAGSLNTPTRDPATGNPVVLSLDGKTPASSLKD